MGFEIIGHKYENQNSKSLEEEVLEKIMLSAMVPEDYLYSKDKSTLVGDISGD